MISILEAIPEQFKDKSLADLKRDHVKEIQAYLASVPASVRRAEEQEDNSQKSMIDHKMKDYSLDLKSKGQISKPGFKTPEKKNMEVH
jgi:hypothetical protein